MYTHRFVAFIFVVTFAQAFAPSAFAQSSKGVQEVVAQFYWLESPKTEDVVDSIEIHGTKTIVKVKICAGRTRIVGEERSGYYHTACPANSDGTCPTANECAGHSGVTFVDDSK